MKKLLYILTISLLITPLAISETINYNKDTICLVRHLKLQKAPRWASKIELSNKKELFFCSPKSMLEFYFRPTKWLNIGIKSEKDFKKVLVTDYNSKKAINAKKAFYVYGSSKISPAGDDLAAFKTKKQAENFARKNAGKRIFKFNEISIRLINLLNGRV